MEGNVSKITSKLESSLNTEPTIEGALSAYQLLVGDLGPNETKEFSLRIWMHSDVTANDKDSMNAVYHGKISVITSYKELLTVIETIQNIPVVTSGVGLYEVSHNAANITFTDDTNMIQNLKQTERRYVGSDPDNYVNFNNELWRIIGLVNTPEGQRVKLIRNEAIGIYSWDITTSSVNVRYGVNEWSLSDAHDNLNYTFYENLLEKTKEMIDTVTWNTGSNDGINYSYTNINANTFYNLERSNNTGKICRSSQNCNDTVERTFCGPER